MPRVIETFEQETQYETDASEKGVQVCMSLPSSFKTFEAGVQVRPNPNDLFHEYDVFSIEVDPTDKPELEMDTVYSV